MRGIKKAAASVVAECARIYRKGSVEHRACVYGAKEVGVHVREFPGKYPATLASARAKCASHGDIVVAGDLATMSCLRMQGDKQEFCIVGARIMMDTLNREIGLGKSGTRYRWDIRIRDRRW